jgi:hypothetical protein
MMSARDGRTKWILNMRELKQFAKRRRKLLKSSIKLSFKDLRKKMIGRESNVKKNWRSRRGGSSLK